MLTLSAKHRQTRLRAIALAAASLVLVLPAAPQSAVDSSPDSAVIKKVDDHYNHLRTLKARYVEHYTGLGADRTETGTLLLRKPGLMRWSYDQPQGKVFVLDGHWAWFYTPGDPQVSRSPAKQLDDLRSPLRFLLGHTQLAKELDHLTLTPAGPNFTLSGAPKGMADRIQSIALTVTPTGIIQAMRMEEVDGGVTTFTFSAMKENVPVRDADFVFTPPAGVTVINGQPPI